MRTRRLAYFVITLVLATLMAGSAFATRGRAGRADRPLRWAERLSEATPVPPTSAHPSGSREGVSTAEGAFRAIIRKYAGSPRAYLGLGRCQMRLGDYEGALHSFARARELSPSNPEARQACQQAQVLMQVSQAVSSQISRGQRVIQIARVPDRQQKVLWAVLSARIGNPRQALWPITDVYLTLFEQGAQQRIYALSRPADEAWAVCHHEASLCRPALTGSAYHQVWRSPELCQWRSEAQDWNEVALKAADLTGSGVPEVAVWEEAEGAGWAPSHLDVFTLRGSRLVKLTGVSSDDPIWIDDLNHDGHYEIGTWRTIGMDMCHPAQPLWGDIYAWKNGCYVLADRYFPRRYRGWEGDLRGVLHCFPHDPEIYEYLGIVREIDGRPWAALAAYRSALNLYRSRPTPGDAAWFRSRADGVRARIEAVRARTRKLAHMKA